MVDNHCFMCDILHSRFLETICLVLILSLDSMSSCFAQPEHRISFGLGWFGHDYVKEMRNEIADVEFDFPEPFDQGSYEFVENDMRTLPINVNFHYECSLNHRFGVGFGFGYDRLRYHQESECIKSVGERTSPHGITYTLWDSHHTYGKLYRNILHLMPELTIYWFKKKHISTYSKVGTGVGWEIQKRVITYPESVKTVEGETKFYFQVSPVCMEAGGRRWRGFVEFGYGVQGILQYGAKYILNGTKKIVE